MGRTITDTWGVGITSVVSGNNIRKARKKLGLTQEQLAQKCDCATNTIGRIERGELQPAQTLKERIAEVLGLRLTVLEPEDQPVSTAPAGPKDHLRTLLQLLGQMSPEDLATVSPVVQALASLAPGGPRGVQTSPDVDSSGLQSDTGVPPDYDIVDVEQLPAPGSASICRLSADWPPGRASIRRKPRPIRRVSPPST